MNKYIVCPSQICGATLQLPIEEFEITTNEDGSWNTGQTVICQACRLEFSIYQNRVTYLGASMLQDSYEESEETELRAGS